MSSAETTFARLIEAGLLAIGDGYRAKNEELGGDGPIFLRAGHVTDRGFDFDGVEHFQANRTSAVRTKMSQTGDVIITTKGNSTGRVAYVTPELPPFVYSPHLSYWRSLDPQHLAPGFLRYWSRSREFQDQLDAMKASTDMAPYLSLVDQRRLRITLPDPDVQYAVAEVLGALDDKIELNHRTTETLEAIARSVFDSWFIDFAPVRAKSEGRTTGLPQELAALFPDSLVRSALGDVPYGWRASTLGGEVRRSGGLIQTGPFGSQLHASDYAVEGVPVVMPQDLVRRTISTARIAKVDEGHAERLSRHRLQVGDIVYSRRGDVERHALSSNREAGWLCGTGCLLVRPGPRWPSPLFLSLALDHLDARAWIVQHAIGATMPNLNTGILSRVPLVVPADEVLHAFERNMQWLSDRITVNDAQSETLAVLRDTLLPRLLSGELRVREAESLVAAAV